MPTLPADLLYPVRGSSVTQGMESTQPDGYEAPEIVDRGALNDLTRGGQDGFTLDQNFSIGTPRGSLTFS